MNKLNGRGDASVSGHYFGNCCTSWNGILIGTLVALGLTVLFHVFTLGLGLTAFTRTEDGVMTLAIAGFAWLFIGGYIVYFIAGWIAARYICCITTNPAKGFLQGFITWSLTLVLSILLLSSLIPDINDVNLAPKKNLTVDRTVVTKTAETNLHAVATHPTTVSSATEKEINRAGIATLSTFLIFLSGALGAGFGGYCAVKYYKKEDEPYDRNDKKIKDEIL